MSGRVAVIGAGYVGLTTAALLANSGIEAAVLEIDSGKVDTIRQGRSPFFEPGLDELIKAALDDGLLNPTTDYREVIPQADFIFCCVGTPDNPDGSSNLKYVYGALKTAAKLAKNGVVFIQKSTVPVGTGQTAIKHIKKHAPKLEFDYVSNPEFLREGSAIRDTLYPDRTVLGGNDDKVLKKVAKLYKAIERAAPHLDPVFLKSYQRSEFQAGEFIFTTLESAELIKVTANAFLALKISFANSIAKLADRVGADINEVMDGIGKDHRIGRAFLNAGRGYGGGCFPKDVSGLIAAAKAHKVEMEIMQAAVAVNSSMAVYVINKISEITSIKNKSVAVLGLSFKAATSDTRRSPAIAIANMLVKKGAKVQAYDPEAIIETEKLHKSIVRTDSTMDAVKGADIVVLATDWPEFVALDFHNVKKAMRGKLIVDGMNALDEQQVTEAGLQYLGVGRF